MSESADRVRELLERVSEALALQATVSVTEEGRVDSPFVRALMLFHDNWTTMITFHRALGTRLGEVVEPERL